MPDNIRVAITSYDSSTNKFYINVPDKSKCVVKTIARIDADTIEKLSDEKTKEMQ